MNNTTRAFEVSVTVTATVSVDADGIPDYLPKSLHSWPDGLVEECGRLWAEQTGLTIDRFNETDLVEISEQDSLDQPSTT
ncbi:hypothetical protein [Prescottella subtropica]|uniref:hypothetical protein n=1 Tax=Prescottella subtropica TaxID=2545757 RepID=UPI0010F4BD5E|nr:hypothetical protein [Prescottella subtropica]